VRILMREVAIVGVGMTPVGEHWDSSIREIGADAVTLALQDARLEKVDALYVGNAFGATFSSQSNVGALIADYAGLRGIEAIGIDAADASGGAALRAGYLAVASGAVDTVMVVGAEKSTDAIGSARVSARSVGLDADYEAVHGATLTALAGLLMRRYMYEYNLELAAFEGFSINAHRNAKTNALAMFRNQIKEGAFARASMVSDPVNLFDGAPDADGAAAVILTAAERARGLTQPPVRIAGSGAATDTFSIQEREDPLLFRAVKLSAERAFRQAGILASDVDLLELHDAFTIVSVLSLEASGFATRGEGWKLAGQAGEALGLKGSLPISTFGGLKARGNPVGATGVYQAAEAVLQLRGQAGANQVMDARTAVIQSVGGAASTAFTHVLTTR
jgi:acetyl-CoA C-acetyltransferase